VRLRATLRVPGGCGARGRGAARRGRGGLPEQQVVLLWDAGTPLIWYCSGAGLPHAVGVDHTELTARWTCAQPARARNACTVTAPVCRADSGKFCVRAARTARPCSCVGAETSNAKSASNHCSLCAGCNSAEKARAARGGHRLELCNDRGRLRLAHEPRPDARDCAYHDACSCTEPVGRGLGDSGGEVFGMLVRGS